jgi:hypothetical protein
MLKVAPAVFVIRAGCAVPDLKARASPIRRVTNKSIKTIIYWRSSTAQ